MDKRIIFNNQDGTLGVIIPSPKCGLSIEEIAKKDVPKGLSYKIVGLDAIPTDRLFRGAWRADSGKINIDLTAAKDIAHAHRRRSRDELMEPLDRQSTIPSEAAQAETKREKVRSDNAKMQSDINAAGSPEALKKALAL